MKKTIKLLKGESWWGGACEAGTEMPFRPGAKYDLRGNDYGNQAAPFLVSSAGRYLWSEDPFRFEFTEEALHVEGRGPFLLKRPGTTLKEAYLEASRLFFPPQQKIPDSLLFTAPQFNTWIELMYDQAQKPILEYARNILKHRYEPGVFMIDEGWAKYYGDWDFNPVHFPNPKKMVQQLHKMGFKVMLWVVPFVVPDSRVFRQLRDGKVLVKGPDGKPVIREWWNGYSAVVDVTGGEGKEWFTKQLDRLQKEYAIDGFKFDAGDAPFYRDTDVLAVPTHANGHTEAFGRLGISYKLNEYRACWKCAGEPLAQRLRDKLHSWDHLGLNCLVPNTLAQGLMGHSFVCPDMIGGGDYMSFVEKSSRMDPELTVRYAQASALMPMMQFSAAPWRVLDKRHAGLCRKAAALHAEFAPTILALAKTSARTGEPIVRHLAYEFPGEGYETVQDQFLLGSNILVAPVLKKGAKTRTVILPPGTWKADDGTEFTGPKTIDIPTPLERIPYFVLKAGRKTEPLRRKSAY